MSKSYESFSGSINEPVPAPPPPSEKEEKEHDVTRVTVTKVHHDKAPPPKGK